MSVIHPNETNKVWQPQGREAGIQLYLSGTSADTSALFGMRVCGLPTSLSLIPVTEWIDPEGLSAAVVAVVQVDFDTPASLKRFERLVQASSTPLIAAAYEPPLALVRSLLRAGAHDVLPLPLSAEDLESSVAPLREIGVGQQPQVHSRTGKLIAAVKSRGGAGATAILTQLACRFATAEAATGRETCLIDFDLQFGDAAFQLGVQPKLTVADLLEAGARLDGELLRSVSAEHSSGLKIVAAPLQMLPLESVTNEHVFGIVERAQSEFGTVFLDLPANWTNWSLSLVARADLVFLITDLTVPGLHRARRQLDFLEQQDVGSADVRVLVNRHEKKMFSSLKSSDVRTALGREASYLIANDPEVLQAAVDQGVPISEIKKRSAIGRDLDVLSADLAATLRRERI